MKQEDIERAFDRKEQPREDSRIGRLIGVVSGKGGVGKSMVTGLAALEALRRGNKVGILDADVTGPSIPRMFGVEESLYAQEDGGIRPARSRNGIKLVSSNLILEHPDDPVIWRGPVISGLIKQFYAEVVWEDLDLLLVDMPPGTGDVPLTVFQSLPVDGLLVVTSPQDLVSMIVTKAVKMAEMMKIPVLGLVENLSYVSCPHCGERHSLFGESHIEGIAREHGIEVLACLPMDPALTALVDEGRLEDYQGPAMEEMPALLERIL